MTAAMSHREADADAWELGEHPCQINGHTASRDPQVTDCQRCGVDLSALEPEDDELSAVVSQSAYCRFSTTMWRGQILMEDLTIDAILEVLALATNAGVPGHALVTFKAGDCVIDVEATTKNVETLDLAVTA